jgi:hypothetical protein
MPERAGNLQPGQQPLRSWRTRPAADVRHWKPFLPELTVTLGRDAEGSGLTVTVWEPTDGEFAAYGTLYAARWASPTTSTQEALEICIRGLTAALAELFPDSAE